MSLHPLASCLKRREVLRDRVTVLARLKDVAPRRPIVERIAVEASVDAVVNKVQPAPVEDLTREYDWHLQMFEALDVPIQLRNANTSVVVPGSTFCEWKPIPKGEQRDYGPDRQKVLTEVLSRRRYLTAKIDALTRLKNDALIRPVVDRVPVTDTLHEVRAIVPTVSAQELGNAISWYSTQRHHLDEVIESANHAVENQIEVDDAAFTDYVADERDAAVTANPGDIDMIHAIMARIAQARRL